MQKNRLLIEEKHQKDGIIRYNLMYFGPASDNSCNQIPRGIDDHR